MLIAGMMLVMGAPFVYFLKRDREWDAASQKSLDIWYH